MEYPPPIHANRASLTRFTWLSIVASIVIIALKGGAYLWTGSKASTCCAVLWLG